VPGTWLAQWLVSSQHFKNTCSVSDVTKTYFQVTAVTAEIKALLPHLVQHALIDQVCQELGCRNGL
jgi:hypothetical protein